MSVHLRCSAPGHRPLDGGLSAGRLSFWRYPGVHLEVSRAQPSAGRRPPDDLCVYVCPPQVPSQSAAGTCAPVLNTLSVYVCPPQVPSQSAARRTADSLVMLSVYGTMTRPQVRHWQSPLDAGLLMTCQTRVCPPGGDVPSHRPLDGGLLMTWSVLWCCPPQGLNPRVTLI